MSPTEEARKARKWSKIGTWVAIYIAVAVTILAVGVWENLGENENQNRAIAQQARALSQANHTAAIAGCHRGNRVREHINVIGGALAALLHKSVEESPEPLTPEQESFLQHTYHLLEPLPPVNCKKEYPSGHVSRDSAPPSS